MKVIPENMCFGNETFINWISIISYSLIGTRKVFSRINFTLGWFVYRRERVKFAEDNKYSRQ